MIRREMSRIESFSDAIFGFSATLLVVSLEVPTQFEDLLQDLKGFGAFGISFMALVMIWLVHRTFFKRFPLDDKMTVILNSILLFVVLFYVYPLKYVSIGVAQLIFGTGGSGSIGLDGPTQLGQLFVLYGLGFIAIFACIALMYRNAWSQREALGYDDVQAYRARFWFQHYGLFCVVGIVSIALAVFQIGLQFGLPGFIYAAIGFVSWIHAVRFQRKHGLIDD